MILQGSRAPRAVSIQLWSTLSHQKNQVFENSESCTIIKYCQLSMWEAIFSFLEAVGVLGSWKKNEWIKSKPLMWNSWAHWLNVSKTFYLQAHVGSCIIVVQLRGGDTWVDSGTKFVLNVFLHTEVISIEIIMTALFVSEKNKKTKKKQPQSPLFFFLKVSWVDFNIG